MHTPDTAPTPTQAEQHLSPEVAEVYGLLQQFVSLSSVEALDDEDESLGRIAHVELENYELGVTIKEDDPEVLAHFYFVDNGDNGKYTEMELTHRGELMYAVPEGQTPKGPVNEADITVVTDLLKRGYAKNLAEHTETQAKKAEARQAEPAAFGELHIGLNEEAQRAIIAKIKLRSDKEMLDFAKAGIHEDGLKPIASQQLTDTLTCHYSSVFSSSTHYGVIAYLEQGNIVTPVHYYLSNSQGVWRYLPYHNKNDEGSTHYGKGDGEESLTLPATMQQSLATLLEAQGGGALVAPHSDGLIHDITPYSETQTLDVSFMDKKNLLAESYFYDYLSQMGDSEWNSPRLPEDVHIDPEYAAFSPDYNQPRQSWQQRHPALGLLTYTLVPSKNGELGYTFVQGSRGKTWLGGAEELNADIRPNGLHQGYVNLGVAGLPAMEYARHAGQFAGEEMYGSYVDIYSTFISKLPIIQEFIENTKS